MVFELLVHGLELLVKRDDVLQRMVGEQFEAVSVVVDW